MPAPGSISTDVAGAAATEAALEWAAGTAGEAEDVSVVVDPDCPVPGPPVPHPASATSRARAIRGSRGDLTREVWRGSGGPVRTVREQLLERSEISRLIVRRFRIEQTGCTLRVQRATILPSDVRPVR